jgi:hypothetical protein
MDENGRKAGWFRLKALVVVLVGAFGLGALFYGSGIGTESPKKSSLPPIDGQIRKPVLAMNLALGPMVFLARELDFTVRNIKGEKLDDSRIAARLEIQLQGLRELYRSEIAKNPKLAGSIILQFTINAAGQVSQVKEITARLNDAEFRQSVAAEAENWNFAELVTAPVTVQIPLLFVQEGMDITTLVRWESSVAGGTEKRVSVSTAKTEPAKPANPVIPAIPVPSRAAAVKSGPAPERPSSTTGTPEGEEVQIRYATLLRKEPNFNAPILTTFTIGTKVVVVNRGSDWLEVRSHHNGPSGYIRKEFVVPADVVVFR